MFVNGQRVTCELDGLAVGCSQAYAALESGSAIPAALAPYQHLSGFRFENQGLGIFTSFVPGHRFSTPDGGGSGTDDDPLRVGSYGYQPPQNLTFYFNVSWSPTGQTRQNIPFDTARIEKALKTLVNNSACKDFIDNLLKEASSRTGNSVAEGGDVVKIFDAIKNNLTRQRPKGTSKSVGNPIGSFKKKNAGLFAVGNSNLNAESQYINDVNVILHEILHLAAFNGDYYSDKLFAEIVHNSPDAAIPYSGNYKPNAVNPFDTSKMTKKERENLENDKGNALWGGYWGRVLATKCFKDQNGNNIDLTTIR